MSQAALTEEMLSQLSPEVRAALEKQLAPVAAPAPVAVRFEVEKASAAAVAPKRAGFLAQHDYSGVSDADSFAPLPEDVDFEGQIIKVEEAVSSAGNDMLKLRIKVLVPSEFAGRLVFDNIMPAHTGDFPRRRTKSLFRACEMLHEEPGACWITAQDSQDLLNEAVRFRVKNDEYNGQITPKVNGLYSRVQDFAGVE